MEKKSITSLIIDKFGLKAYQKSLRFLANKINIIDVKENPIKIRSIILDNEREFHLIIDEKNNEIFHDCPSFLIYSEREKKVCVHLIKLLLIIKSNMAQNIIDHLNSYNFTSEDIGSQKKKRNFLLLANRCFDDNNCVEALSYLNKAIVNQFESEDIIKKYLDTAINNNLFIEFFDFLRNGYENELEDYLSKFNHNIERGFIEFLNVISEYSFFDLLKIIESIDIMFKFKDFSFLASEFDILKKLVKSSNFNENYFSIYLIKRYNNQLIRLNNKFSDIFSQDHLDSLKKTLLNYFFSEIDNFCIIDKLKLLKKQFQVIDIPKKSYINEYKKYKNEIQELEKKVYLKKFAFLKLMIEKYNIKKTKGEFLKERNTYVVKHRQENLNNPVYNYIISRIGFFGINERLIKSSEIGINYFIMKELFSDDIGNFQDVFYYMQQFWGEKEDYEIRLLDGLSLSSEIIEYSYDIDHTYSNDLMIIEWDLAHKPFHGSIVNAYGSQIIIPDNNNPLFHDLKPFDLCFCKKTPVKIESKIIKTVNVIKKCSFRDAIKSVSKGMEFIEGYYPLSLVRAVLNREIDPFHANEIVFNNPNKVFVPNYNAFIKAFNEFLLNYIFKEKEYIFEELKTDIILNPNQILTLLNLNNELAGLDLPYTEILKKNLYPNITIKQFRTRFLNEIHSIVQNLLNQRKVGSTIIFDLKKIQHTPFFKYSNEILDIRKEEFEKSKVIKFSDKMEVFYDMTEINKTYYGKKFLEILQEGEELILKPKKYKKFQDFSLKLNLRLKVVQSEV